VPRLAKAFLEKRGATDVRIDDKDRKTSERVTVAGKLDGKQAVIEIWAPGSKQAFESLATGGADIGMASRAVHAPEAEKLRSIGDMASPACEHVLGEDGIAVIVNQSNKVGKLTLQQLAGLFSGEITDWSKVGGEPGKQACVFARRQVRTSTFNSIAMGGKTLKKDPVVTFEDSEVLQRCGQGCHGNRLRRAALRQAGEGARDRRRRFCSARTDRLTVATEDHALSRRLIFIRPRAPKPAGPAVHRIRAGDEGQAIVENVVFVPRRFAREPERRPARLTVRKGDRESAAAVGQLRFVPPARRWIPCPSRPRSIVAFLSASIVARRRHTFGSVDTRATRVSTASYRRSAQRPSHKSRRPAASSPRASSVPERDARRVNERPEAASATSRRGLASSSNRDVRATRAEHERRGVSPGEWSTNEAASLIIHDPFTGRHLADRCVVARLRGRTAPSLEGCLAGGRAPAG
jgi:hypothetical protein